MTLKVYYIEKFRKIKNKFSVGGEIWIILSLEKEKQP